MISIYDLDKICIGEVSLNIDAFDCERETVNDFFKNEAMAYQEELFGKTYFFVTPDTEQKKHLLAMAIKASESE